MFLKNSSVAFGVHCKLLGSIFDVNFCCKLACQHVGFLETETVLVFLLLNTYHTILETEYKSRFNVPDEKPLQSLAF